MAIRRRLPSFLLALVVPAVAATATAYFAMHIRIGLDEKGRIEADVAAVKARLERIRSDRETLERRVVLLRDAGLDRDMIDERARAILNFGQGGDVVVLRNVVEPLQVARR